MSRIERKRRKRSVRVDRVYDGDVYVRVNSVGSSGDRSFILIPGIGVSSTYFERLAPHLNEFGPVHALDLPGFGGVPHPSSTLTIREYADLVGRVIDELDLKDPIIVGHSMGSQVVSDPVSRRAPSCRPSSSSGQSSCPVSGGCSPRRSGSCSRVGTNRSR